MRALPEHKLDKRVVTYWRIMYAINLAILTVIAAVVVFFVALSDSPGAIATTAIITAVVLVILWIAFIFLVPPFRYTRWRYEVSETEVDMMEGILVRKRTILPLIRVQGVHTSQGPLMRAFDISEVGIETAAGTHKIPALNQDEAAKLRDHISALAQVAQEDV